MVSYGTDETKCVLCIGWIQRTSFCDVVLAASFGVRCVKFFDMVRVLLCEKMSGSQSSSKASKKLLHSFFVSEGWENGTTTTTIVFVKAVNVCNN